MLFFWSIAAIMNIEYCEATSNISRQSNWTINEHNLSHKAQQVIPRSISFDPSSNHLQDNWSFSRLIASPLSTNATNATNERCKFNAPLLQNCYLCLAKVNDSNDASICPQRCGAIYHSQCFRIWKHQIRQNQSNQTLINSTLCPKCFDQNRINRLTSSQIPQRPEEISYAGCVQCVVGFIAVFGILVIITLTSE